MNEADPQSIRPPETPDTRPVQQTGEQAPPLAELAGQRKGILALVRGDEPTIDLPSGERSLPELLDTLAGALSKAEMLEFVEGLIARQSVDDFKDLLEVLEIFRTTTSFTDPENVEILEATAKQYGLVFWAERQGKDLTVITRADLGDWWDFFTQMAASKGFQPGSIDVKSQQNNLWKATSELAKKMSENPAAYRFLPAYLINNPQEVARALDEIANPIAFIEVLTGEAWEDLCRSAVFLEAFGGLGSEVKAEGSKEAAIATVMLALQRK